MGSEKMRNLSETNILFDDGSVAMSVVRHLERKLQIKLPRLYVTFITAHNGACILSRIFDYNDPNRCRESSDSVAFTNAETIADKVKSLQSAEEPDWDVKYRFEDGLIPFGDNGGGDMICFDYRTNRTTDDPPIVIWNHDMGLEHRVVFIANNFEEFVNMLHEPEDE